MGAGQQMAGLELAEPGASGWLKSGRWPSESCHVGSHFQTELGQLDDMVD